MIESRAFGEPKKAVPGAPVLVYHNIAENRFSLTPGRVIPFTVLTLEYGWQPYTAPSVGQNVVGRWGPLTLINIALSLQNPGTTDRFTTLPEGFIPTAATVIKLTAYELKSSRINVPYLEIDPTDGGVYLRNSQDALGWVATNDFYFTSDLTGIPI